MRFSKDFLDSLRERVPLSAILAPAVSWDKRRSQPAKGDFWACCPFHDERTPSFHVDDTKGFYHCFGCHQSGDHIRFLMDHGGLDFPAAVAALAEAAGVALPERPHQDDGRAWAKAGARTALEAAQAFYCDTLWGPAGDAARRYAVGRGITEATLRAFAIGLAPSADGALSRHLAAEGIGGDDLERAGLGVRGERGALRERFRGRLMVPIHDGRGRIVGFGGRALDGRDPKYLNSPETELFDKSALLFNAHRARGPSHRLNRLFVVEGYLDAIALAAAGIETVVASLGTALTEAQIDLAWQLADEPVLCFDGDSAGRAAASRALGRIVPKLSPGRSFHLLALPQGKDPDDVVREGGRAAFEAAAAHAVPLVDALFEREAARGADTPERLAAMETRLESLAAEIADRRLAALYRAAFRERFFALRRSAGPAGAARRQGGRAPAVALTAPARAENALLEIERVVLGLLIRHPPLLDAYSERLSTTAFQSAAHGELAAMILEAYAAGSHDAAGLLAALPDRARMLLGEIWGDPDDPAGPRLVQRFPVLSARPDEGFVRRFLDVCLAKLDVREQCAELADLTAGRHDGSGADEARVLSLSSAVEAQRAAIAEAEHDLAEEAAQWRRAAAGGAPPGDRLIEP